MNDFHSRRASISSASDIDMNSKTPSLFKSKTRPSSISQYLFIYSLEVIVI